MNTVAKLSSAFIFLALFVSSCSTEQSSKTPPTSKTSMKVKEMGTIMAPASKVWNTISTFSEAELYMAPIITQSSAEGSGIGMVRKLTTGDGQEVVEKLTALDGEQMSLSYIATQSGLPMTDYSSTIRVKDLGKGNCQVYWEGAFNPSAEGSEVQVKAALKDVYGQGIFGLKKIHMASSSETGVVNKPAKEVWKILSGFDAVERYVSQIETSKSQGSGLGARRFCVTKEGEEISEQVIYSNSSQMVLRYEGLDSSIPMAGYEARIKVKDLGEEKCEVNWSSVYKPLGATAEEVDAIISAMYKAGIAGLDAL